ncbi:hypothetical protein NX774_08730 [Massilia agilis]|uniref:Uncharacterized protein n=1 Tax=Massilia agilis TaxID=1811226 RepID=A0ABT2D9T0_9BURK|nr:hypothetical protein [Massilia agilis]MCS0808004.1 hypothetical protein [Massilia agilis]
MNYVFLDRRGIEFPFPTQTLHLVDAAAVGVASVASTGSGKGVPATTPA